MTTLSIVKKKMVGPLIGADAAVPVLAKGKYVPYRFHTDEDDGLFAGYGTIYDNLPYTMQDQYDTPEVEQEFNAVILENQYLRATIVPDVGGKLWALYDKEAERDILYNNPKFLPNNLAIRNAWTAGGIEYNIGRTGHDAQTCSPRFTAVLKDDDGTPVLRIYEFARDPAIPFQIDFYLPEGSRQLYARVRLFNVNDHVVPIYWWSNIAVSEVPGCRVILPAENAFVNTYEKGKYFEIRKEKIGEDAPQGFDGTYPADHRNAKDYFYNIPANHRKYETLVYPDGYGVLFASTSRLQGRKLFVWGQGEGSRNWQQKLAPKELGGYAEIQGGVCKSQWEYMPMPPRTAWEWVEAYGSFQADPEKCFGKWKDAVAYMEEVIDKRLPGDFLEEELKRTRQSFACKPGEVIVRGSQWGALEEKRRGEALEAHLDFGEPGEAVADWSCLLETGTMPEGEPRGILIQQEWLEKLRECKEQNWKINYFLGLFAFRNDRMEQAEEYFRKSIAQNENAWNLMALADLCMASEREDEMREIYEKLIVIRPDDVSLIKTCLKNGVNRGLAPEKILEASKNFSEDVLRRPYVKFCLAMALFQNGRIDEAEAIITENGGLVLADAREGETTITQLYIDIQIQRAAKEGRTITEKDVNVPRALDLRMKEVK